MQGAAVAQGDELGAQSAGLACTDVLCVQILCVTSSADAPPSAGTMLQASLGGWRSLLCICGTTEQLGWNGPYSPLAPSLQWAGCPSRGPPMAWGASQLSGWQCQGRIAAVLNVCPV